MKNDRFELEQLLAEDRAEHPLPPWALALLVVIALALLVLMLRF